ncbi:3-keto-disaccharide hydrolase [Neolewinella sp.]|uniref:3-keto-disaccharide hydrolase n=1 Tax=Neolewinella sp. TaxID=2993543 RepID=UPI003B52D07B
MKALPLAALALFLLTCNRPATTALFNGENLDGWTAHGTERWYVENGEIICESGPDGAYGYLSTNKDYDDFELTLEFLQEADGNSGVFIRSSVEGTRVSGWQVEVAPPGHDTGGIYESYGRGWLIKPGPEKDKYLKMGEWNTLKIRAEGPTVTSWLNGEEMVTLTDEQIGEGEGGIALQIHDGGGIRVRWRNIELRPLAR